ncbi:argininosuccinate lyase [Candidatus Poribacteria bacterium]|nr:argininosuccinate lyase [Candidatus Poribacteria bacterium]
MSPVWGHRLEEQPEELSVLYCAGRDVKSLPMADEILITYDIWNTEAHDIMLYKQGILTKEEVKVILSALDQVRKLHEKDQFKLDPQKEDVHMNIESFITEKCDPVIGRKVHTGRSRNDQIVCDMRMYLREKILKITDSLITLVEALLNVAQEHIETVMPGFTHYQHATISTFGHLLTSYAQAMERDLDRMEFVYSITNRCPLGAAAGYGTSWPIDRDLTAKLLGFDEVQENSIDCVSSRWETEAQFASAISFMMNHLSIMSQDFVFLSTSEAGMLKLDDRFVLGSSIMPQKRNPGPLEVTRAKAAIAQGTVQALFGISKASLSGYNRDGQYTKYLIMDIINECELAPVVLKEVVKSLQVNKGEMQRQASLGFLNAVDVADYLTRKFNLPFRQAYHIVAESVKLSDEAGELTLSAVNQAMENAGVNHKVDEEDFGALTIPQKNVSLKSHIGGPAPDAVLKTIKNIGIRLSSHRQTLSEAVKRLERAKIEIESIKKEF